ncbi:MAG: Hsp33 family molecular chaperone HslO [Aquificae bacterium]|nr:Hsp33 family molecular chaperone HslO [Aquificota bacterium]
MGKEEKRPPEGEREETAFYDWRKKIDEQVKRDLKDYFQDRDYVVMAVPKEEPLRVWAVKATNTARTAQRVHRLSPMAAAVMGRAIVGAILLSSLIKHGTDQKVGLKIEGDGPIGYVYVEVDGKGRVRGLVKNPDVPLFTKEVNGKTKLDIARAIGNGTLTVIKDLGMGKPYVGVVPLVSGEIAEDIAYYLAQSEQIPSAVGIGVKLDEKGEVKVAGGWMVQEMGGTSEKALQVIEDAVKKLPPVSDLLEQGKRPEDIALMIIPEELNPHLLGLKEIEYYCPCDEKIVEGVVAGLPQEEVDKIFEENQFLEVTCHFCGKVYRYTREQVEEIRSRAREEEKPSDRKEEGDKENS